MKTKQEEVTPSGEQSKWSTWSYVETRYGAKVSASEFELQAHWRGLATIEKVRDAIRLAAAAPALYAACQAMRKSLNGSPSDFAGMLAAHRQLDAAVALVDAPQETK